MTAILRALRPWCLAGATLIFAGCGSSPAPRTSDASEAQQALQTVLDAWKAGEKPEDLAKRTPPIHVKDLDWGDGFKLVDYKAGDEGRLVGYDMNYSVSLELKSPQGAPVKKTAVYTITTRPELFISRQEGWRARVCRRP